MKVLLDTNVWRYLIDSKNQDLLYNVTRKSNVKICIAPIVVVETLRLSDSSLRRRIVEAQTRDCWHRLMPDAFLQCEDVKSEMIRLHPEWIIKKRDVNLYRRLRYDWIRAKGGFWEKTRVNTDVIANRYRTQDASALNQVRQQLRDVRSSVVENGAPLLNAKRLKDFTGSWTNKITGEIVVSEFWRVYAELIWCNMLSADKNSAFYQWISCDIDIEFLLWGGYPEFLNFWQSEAQLEALPREWIRAAIYALQSERKVTDGNPVDAAISVHLVDVDAIISADKNLIAMVNRIQDEAPFQTAHGYLISSGKEGIEQLFKLLSQPIIYGNSSSVRH